MIILNNDNIVDVTIWIYKYKFVYQGWGRSDIKLGGGGGFFKNPISDQVQFIHRTFCVSFSLYPRNSL